MNTKVIQSKMKSIKGIGKITKTMEMVSVAKMKKSTTRAHLGRTFETRARSLLENLPGSMYQHPYYTARTGDRVLLVLIGSDRGLCGGYNAQLVRHTSSISAREKIAGNTVEICAVGKSSNAIARRLHIPVVASFGILPELFDAGDVYVIAQFITRNYLDNDKVARVIVVSQSVDIGITTSAKSKQLLPLSYTRAKRDPEIDKIKIEPGPTRFLEVVVPGLVEALLVHAILEARAAEHTARMVAMKSATESAAGLYKELTRNYNKARQAAITQEIAEVVGGATSLEVV